MGQILLRIIDRFTQTIVENKVGTEDGDLIWEMLLNGHNFDYKYIIQHDLILLGWILCLFNYRY